MIERRTVETTIGKSFADKLDETIIDISKEISYSRREMIEKLGCANFLAAYRLQKVLKRLKIFTPATLYKTDPFSLVRSKGIGEAAMFVAMCILNSHNYDVQKWWGWKNTNVLRFGAFKHKAIKNASKRGKHEL